ncbi:ESX secretion-associated protein EspG [Amycolatopsis magusensis]|uniref:ESX secretion-associated protein EspG n=1 Tax=Amycolatopsis magusensis TaxID=882444 RepID=UPI003C2C1268
MEFWLPTTVIDVLGERFGTALVPPPFEVPYAGSTTGERQRVREKAWQQLRDARLAKGDKLDPDVENLLRVWYRPEVLITGRLNQEEGQRDIRYRAVSEHLAGVLSGQVGDQISFEACHADDLVAGLMRYLPHLGPVNLRPVAVTEQPKRVKPVEEDEIDPRDLIDAYGETEPADHRAAQAFFSWPVGRFGVFDLWVRGRDGRLNAQGGVQLFDTQGGRFVIIGEKLSDGSKRRHFVPSDGSHLRRWIHDRVARARDDR